VFEAIWISQPKAVWANEVPSIADSVDELSKLFQRKPMALVTTVLAGEPELYSLQVARDPQFSPAGRALHICIYTGGIAAATHTGTTLFGHFQFLPLNV
jgi:hypothetical protein